MVTTGVTIAAGPELLRLVFGADYQLGRGVLAALATGTGAYLLAATAAQSLVALRRYGVATATWFVSAVVFLAILAAPMSLVPRISVGFLAACAAAAVLALAALLRATR
jgi:O-antigen/teichoic acid export membrane protein